MQLPPFRSWIFLPAVALIVAAAAAPYAEVIDDIYTARIAVADRSPAALRSARREGLAQVLVKASGDGKALARPEAAEAVGAAERYLLRYSYEEDGDDGSLTLSLDYDERAVQQILRDARLPLWTANRPPILAWLLVSDTKGRRFVGAGVMPEETDVLDARFRERGLPLQLPLFDLEDMAILSPGAAWRQSSPAIVAASRRYRGAEILAGRVAHTSTGRWVGDWRFLYEGRWLTRPVATDSYDEFVAAGADLAASTISGRYAVTVLEGGDQRHRVTLRGVRSYGDYVSAQRALGGLEAVRRVVPERLVGDLVSLRIEADADLVQLGRIIELDERFVPTPAGVGESGLFYEWIQ
jgi:hypothetical protein